MRYDGVLKHRTFWQRQIKGEREKMKGDRETENGMGEPKRRAKRKLEEKR